MANKTAPTKAAVRKADWDRFKLDGGSLVVYPPRKGGEMAGMLNVWISDAPPPAVTVQPGRGPIKPITEKARG